MFPFTLDKAYQMDLLEGLGKLPNSSIGLIVTDPPFNIGYKYDEYVDSVSEIEYTEWCNKWIKECFRVLSDEGSVYLMCLSRQSHMFMNLLSMYGVFQNHIAWKRPCTGSRHNHFRPDYQSILFYSKTKDNYFNRYADVRKTKWKTFGQGEGRKGMGDLWDDIHFIYAGAIVHKEAVLNPGLKSKVHPAQFPIALAERCINFSSKEDDIVLDPLCGCYSGDTEVFTNKGWRYFGSLDGSERIASLVDQSLRFVKPLTYFKHRYKGKLMHLTGMHHDLKVTPNHNMYLLHRFTKKPVFRRADGVPLFFHIVRTAKWNGKKEDTFILPSLLPCKHKDKRKIGMRNHKQMYRCNECNCCITESTNKPQQYGRYPLEVDMNSFLEFMGIYLSEGWGHIHIKKNTTWRSGCVCVSQKKYVDKFRRIIDRLPFKWKYYKPSARFLIYNTQLTTWLIKNCGKTSNQKKIPHKIKNLDVNNLKHLLHGLLLGDGTLRKNGSWTYYTISHQLAEDVLEIGMKLGYGCQMRTIPPRKKIAYIKNREIKSKSDLFVVSGSISHLTPRINKKAREVDYDGYVYCVEVPSHVILVRRNGKPLFCGNSGSTGVGAINLNRHFLGFDISRKYVDLSNSRIKKAINNPDKKLKQISLPH